MPGEDNHNRPYKLLMELGKEAAALRDELRKMSRAIFSERLRSLEKAVTQNPCVSQSPS